MKILVVGAGLSGSVIARELADSGLVVTVIDKRPHVAGNCYDYINNIGIRIHKYGPHLFHTSNQQVFDYLSRFTDWLPYRHRVKALLKDGSLVTIPVNKETSLIVGKENVLDIFYRPYSKKMWGVPIEALDPSIMGRVPIREDMNEDYFPNDLYQGLPKHGYTVMATRILEHTNISVELEKPFESGMVRKFDHVFNSMAIDEFFGFRHGVLPYRSIKFHHFDLPVPNLFNRPSVNFTHDGPFTRLTEWKNLPGHGAHAYLTSITVEEPCDFSENEFERYYPVKDVDGLNRALYARYAAMTPANMTFIGRCGLYAYLDMHQAVSTALAISKKFLQR